MVHQDDMIFSAPDGEFEVAFGALTDSQITDWGLMSTGIPDAHKLTQGDGIKVAILDTGTSNHVDLNDNIIDRRSTVYGSSTEDKKGHGCILPSDLVYTSIFGIKSIEYVFENIPCEDFVVQRDTIIRDISKYNFYTVSVDKNGDIVKGNIKYIHKLPYNDAIYNVILDDGELHLTPWHPVYINNKLDVSVRADQLNIGDNLYSYQKERNNQIKDIVKTKYSGFVYDFTIDGYHNYIANGYMVSNTHCSGIVAALDNNIGVLGVAPKAKLIQIKVINDNGIGDSRSLVSGIELAESLGADIINMSFGSTIEPPQFVHEAIKTAANKGIILVAAAGNNAGEIAYPARYDEVIATAAMDRDGGMAKFSSRGEKIDFGAPGVQIYSTYLNNQYAVFSGTSQACPFISGCCALILSYLRSNPSVAVVKNYIDMLKILDRFSSSQPGTIMFAKNSEFGYGVPKFANVDWLK